MDPISRSFSHHFAHFLLVLALLLVSAGCASLRSTFPETDVPVGFDPVSSDPSPFDETNPPRLAETVFDSGDAGLNAILYESQGPGPHPTVVLLHGFPGNERNLDLAQAIRRAGWNVVFFHYRGAWGSGGTFTFLHVLEDVEAVVDAISRPAFAADHRIDPARIALVGHSMGGFAALVAGAELERVRCVASISGANLGAMARTIGSMPERAADFAKTLDGWSGPIRGPGGAALVAELVRYAERFDTTSHASALARKGVLLIAGGRDRVTPATFHHEPLAEALRAADARSLATTIFEQADHAYSGHRIALARRVIGWLETDCERQDWSRQAEDRRAVSHPFAGDELHSGNVGILLDSPYSMKP